MFVGHVAVALAAKKKAPEVSLGWLLAAAITLDILWPFMVLLGIEQVVFGSATGGFEQLTFPSYPWSHSLLMSIGWGAGVWGVARWRGVSRTAATWLALLVVSHWVLDWISHAPDMPLLPWGGPKLGLGLWGSIPATLIVEGGIFLAGIWVYLRATRAKDRIGSWGLWVLLLLLMAAWASTPWSPVPTSIPVLIWSSVIFEAVMLAWATWADEHRVVG